MPHILRNPAVTTTRYAWLNGFIGVVIFSGSLPATRLAVLEMDPLLLTFLRASIAGVFAGLLLLVFRPPRLRRSHILPLVFIASGVVLGFPLLTALALQHITAAQSIIFLGLLPLATALFAVLRGGERPRRAFWFFALSGSGCVAGFAAFATETLSPVGCLLMLGAILVCGAGYAEGAKLTQEIGGWQAICWALILSLPFMLLALGMTATFSSNNIHHYALPTWFALGYVSLFSMLIGFIFWYQGLAAGGIAAIGQLQLLQPFFGLVLSALMLQESVGWPMLATMCGVILCVAGARKYAK